MKDLASSGKTWARLNVAFAVMATLSNKGCRLTVQMPASDKEIMMPNDTYRRHVILSGCSGGGKSTLLAELERRGFETVPEPGRRIVAEELQAEGRALPWVNLEAFARRAIDMSVRDRERLNSAEGWVFFDRGLIDAAVALEFTTGVAVSDSLGKTSRFHFQVFLTPPWPEIYAIDADRQHGLDEAIGEYQRLLDAYGQLGYEKIILPKTDVGKRADFILDCLSRHQETQH